MPWAPSEHDQSGSIIMQGLQLGNQNAQALGNWLSNFIEHQQQIKAAGKSAEYFVRANPDALGAIGLHPDEFGNLGAREKAAAVQGFVQGQGEQRAAQEVQARVALQKSQTDWFNQRAQEQLNEGEGGPLYADELDKLLASYDTGTRSASGPSPAFPPGTENIGALGALRAMGINIPLAGGTATGTAAEPTPPMPRIMLKALSNLQAMNPRAATGMYRQILPALLQNPDAAGRAPTPTWTKGPTGRYAVTVPGSKQFQLDTDPSEWARAMAAGQIPAVPVTDSSGNVLGNVYADQRGNLQKARVAGEPPALPAAFNTAYHGTGIMPGLEGSLQIAQRTAGMSDKEIKAIHGSAGGTPQEIRDRAAQQVPVLKQRLQDLFRQYQLQGYGGRDLWDFLYQKHGLTNPASGEQQGAARPTGASAPAAATAAAATRDAFPEYKTAQDVTAAYRAGKFGGFGAEARAKALAILRNKFGAN